MGCCSSREWGWIEMLDMNTWIMTFQSEELIVVKNKSWQMN